MEEVDCNDLKLKIDKVLELLYDHPFLVSNPENARKLAEFRIFSLRNFNSYLQIIFNLIIYIKT